MSSETIIDVTKSNFLNESNDFLSRLSNAAFISIDEEMTGINVPTTDGKRPFMPKDDTPQERYLRIKGAAERYSIIQFGISLFFENDSSQEEEGYHVRIYNFHLFSNKREVIMNPSAIDFLTNQGTDFNIWMKEGITYTTQEESKLHWKRYEDLMNKMKTQKTKSPSIKRMKITSPEDIQFISDTMESIRVWLLDDSKTFELPSCNSYRRRALYEEIGYQYPDLILEKGNNWNIVVHQLSEEDRQKHFEMEKLKKKEKMQLDQIGFFTIVDALSKVNQNTKNPIPIVIHNGFMDLLFIMTHFYQSNLPTNWIDIKKLISQHFPLLYDTKYIAMEYHDYPKTDLASLYSLFYPHQSTKDAHNAGFDSFMTGSIFYHLCPKPFFSSLKQNILNDVGIFGKNKLNLMFSMFNIDLMNENDPMSHNLNLKNTFKISNIDSSLRNDAIYEKMKSTTDYVITWLDDTTFLLSSNQNENTDKMYDKLKKAFPNYTIESFHDYKHSTTIKHGKFYQYLMYPVLSYFGTSHKKRKLSDM